MVSSRDLWITWGGDNRYWTFTSDYESRCVLIPCNCAFTSTLPSITFPFEIMGNFNRANVYVPSSLCPRFAEVAQLLQVCWLDLGGKISSTMLSPKTCYAAYFVFQLEEDSGGFQSPVQEASISIGAHVSETRVILKPDRRRNTDPTIQIPRTRDDGWMEIEMGEFLNDDYEESVRFRFRQVTRMNWKSGLIVQGIEFRPKN